MVNTLMFSCNNQMKTSLEDIAADLHQHFATNVSKEALHKKFNAQGVQFLKELIKTQLSHQLNGLANSEWLSHFSCFKIKDSSRFSLPDTYRGAYPGFGNFSKKNGIMQLQYEYDLLSGEWETIELTNIKNNDQKDANQTLHRITEKGLYIRDLGYITPNYLTTMLQESAYFLNRMPPQANIYTIEKELLDWKSIDQRFTKTAINSLDLDILLYEKHLLPCRLIIERLSDQEYKKRLDGARNSAKSRAVGLSAKHKIRCRYNIYITNIDRKILPIEAIRKIYYLRWQIELVFKTWKSFFEINYVKKVKKERMECQLLAQLLFVLINWQLFNVTNQYVQRQNPKTGVSILKFFKRCLSFAYTLRGVILQPQTINQWLKNVFLPAIYNTACQAPRGKLTHYQVINSWLTTLS